jgi:hypothetical protein
MKSTWKHSLLISYHREVKGECQVRIGGKKIVVSYERPDGLTVYEGEELAAGHFRLTCARKGGRATLHRVPGEDLREGSWIEGQEKGMWQIKLENAARA